MKGSSPASAGCSVEAHRGRAVRVHDKLLELGGGGELGALSRRLVAATCEQLSTSALRPSLASAARRRPKRLGSARLGQAQQQQRSVAVSDHALLRIGQIQRMKRLLRHRGQASSSTTRPG